MMKTKIIFVLVAIFAMYSHPLFHKKESVRTEKKFKLCNATKW